MKTKLSAKLSIARSLSIFALLTPRAPDLLAQVMYSVTDLGSNVGPEAINNNGQVVGSVSPIDQAFLYSGGVMTNLGPFGSCGSSAAYGINNWGQVVGQCGVGPFLFSNGIMTNLNSLIDPNSGWTLLARIFHS